ncbi:unnamed protein product [Callosobruchus maculatus]|uniref:Uncharacterized protein n=1 Tax=Callosobruchus maculatus TaxID=64391 RepID=A0A653DPV1_CALMS|nr:unnamed protein product [Callosobruchus maculatus]
MLRSYLDNGFPLSLSTSRIVSGKFFPPLCLAERTTAWFGELLLVAVGLLLGVGLEPATMADNIDNIRRINSYINPNKIILLNSGEKIYVEAFA